MDDTSEATTTQENKTNLESQPVPQQSTPASPSTDETTVEAPELEQKPKSPARLVTYPLQLV